MKTTSPRLKALKIEDALAIAAAAEGMTAWSRIWPALRRRARRRGCRHEGRGGIGRAGPGAHHCAIGAPMGKTNWRTQCAIGFTLRAPSSMAHSALHQWCAIENRPLAHLMTVACRASWRR